MDARPALAMIPSAERHLGIEAVGQHPLVVAHQLVVDADVAEREARQLGDVESFFASSRAFTMSISLTEPVSFARALKSSSSPVRTVRSLSCFSTICRPSAISFSSTLAQ